MKLHEGEIYCEYHGCIHDTTVDPYDYGYAESGEEPECGPEDWYILWVGRNFEEKYK